jgi:hypothetical protein
MGILTSDKAQASPVAERRKSKGLDLSALKPLNATGTKNFGGYRDKDGKAKKRSGDDAMDSDAEEEDEVKIEEPEDDKDPSGNGMLSPDDAIRQGELAEGVRKIKVSKHTRLIIHPTLTYDSSNASIPPSL